MDLEEHTIESVPRRCESCGASLTPAERQAALESSTPPVLCTTCAAEQAALDEDGEDAGEEL